MVDLSQHTPTIAPAPQPAPASASPRLRAWAAALAASVLIAALAVAPPHLGEGARAAVMEGFSIACHQQPDRSFATAGVSWALCHRCTGVLGGLLLGLVGALALRTPRRALRFRGVRMPLLVGAVAVVALDWALGAVGLYDLVATRVATGAVFGVVAGLVLGEALRWSGVERTGGG